MLHREAIESRIATYPDGAVRMQLADQFALTRSTIQLEFSLLALRDDPLPQLQSQLLRCQSADRHMEAAEIVAKMANENSKRERWAVGLLSLFDTIF